MNLAPIVRIIIRYGAGIIIGMEGASALADDPDAVEIGVVVITALIGLATEWWYARAVRNGNPT